MIITAAQVREARKLLSLTQTGLAAQSGVDAKHLDAFERGKRRMSMLDLSVFQRMLEAAGIKFIAEKRRGAGREAEEENRLIIFCYGTLSTHGRPMLTKSQFVILEALPKRNQAPVPTAVIFELLGIQHPSNVQRASMSRSLAHFAELGLALRRTPEVHRQGKGYLWSRA